MFIRQGCAASLFFVVLSLASAADAQVTAGVAVIVARTTTEANEPGTFSPPPSGTAAGIVGFVAVPIHSKLALSGELSVPRQTTTVETSSHPGGTFTNTTRHRDVVLSGLLRVHVESWCHLVAGAGVVVRRTSASSAFRDNFVDQTFTHERTLPRSTRLALTAGADFPIHLAPRVSLLPTARMHYLSRTDREPPPGIDSQPIGRPGKVALRVGVGVQVEL